MHSFATISKLQKLNLWSVVTLACFVSAESAHHFVVIYSSYADQNMYRCLPCLHIEL